MAILWISGLALGQEKDSATPAAISDSLMVEKLKLQIEQLKLENQRLELQIKTLQMGNIDKTPTPTIKPTSTPADYAWKKFAKDMADKAQALSEQNAAEEHKLVLDFSNGEMWYKGVHYKIANFKDLCEDQKWKASDKFLRYDINGDSLYRRQFQNMYFEIYGMQTRGVFVMEAPKNDGDFSFITPETITEKSGFWDFRKLFETAYFIYDKEDKQKGCRVIRFKHPAGFLGFDDVLEFWFDNKDNFVKLRWGLLDKK